MKKRDIIWGTSLALVLAFAIITSVSADTDDGYSLFGFRHCGGEHHMNSENHQDMMDAMNLDSYQEWLTSVSELPFGSKMTEFVTPENFDQFKEAHELMLAGDHEAAREIMEELGIHGQMMGQRKGHKGDRGFNNEKHEAIESAVESGDYDTWKSLASDNPRGQEMLDKITEENFSKLKEAHDLRESGDYEGSKAIMEELGIDKGRGFKEGMKYGMMNGMSQ